MQTECDEWQKWTGLFPVDYLLYLIYGVSAIGCIHS